MFLLPQVSYSAVEAVNLLALRPREVASAIAAGDIETVDGSSGGRIPWQEVAALITLHHPQAFVEEALAPDALDVLPELVRLAELRLRVPRYQAAMLRSLAEREHLQVDEFMSRHLLDLASSECEWLDEHVPGFSDALAWPR